MATREWKTEGEIKSIVHDLLAVEMGRINETLDLMRDGAQASILSANLLHGNPAIGMKGAIPDLQERLQKVEEKQTADEARSAGRFEMLERGMEELKRGQHRARRMLVACWKFATTHRDDDKDKLSWWKIGTLLGALGTAAHWLRAYVPVLVKKIVAAAHVFAM